MTVVATIEQLEAIYGRPNDASTVKVADHVTPLYRVMIEASPFVALATGGAEGLDCSPRGDLPGFVRIADETHADDARPPRQQPRRQPAQHRARRRVGLLFLVPGSGTTLRVNGRAHLSVDPTCCASFAIEGKAPRSVIVINVEAVYFQCARAISALGAVESRQRHVDPKTLPTPGQILAC